jgi:hypothetical protein
VSFVAETETDSYHKKFFVLVSRNFIREVQSNKSKLILTGKKLSKAMPSNVRKKKRLNKN